MKLLYFAWVRERIGTARRKVELPRGVATVADSSLADATAGPEYDDAFAEPR